ncbi:hypothetical protein VE04_10294 [Pseudogymnoascus sp. 24MN13]|nr:hypothetical protein VE04_10294 [Pseudogymnoascus sp. 24MN13]
MRRQTLQLQETVLGKDHPDTLMSMNNLAESLRQQGNSIDTNHEFDAGSHLSFLNFDVNSGYSQLGLAILPTDVKLITKPEDLYQWSILTAGKAALFNKQLCKHSTGAYIDLCNGVGVNFKAVLGKGAADHEQETRLVATSTDFDAPENSREHHSSDAITFQLSAKE